MKNSYVVDYWKYWAECKANIDSVYNLSIREIDVKVVPSVQVNVFFQGSLLSSSHVTGAASV